MMNTNTFSERLVNENVNLVKQVIWRDFKGNLNISRLDRKYLLDEMISVGNIALVQASHTWDESRGIKFSTYAGTCIRHKLYTYLNQEYHKQLDDGQSISMSTKVNDDGEDVNTLEDLLGDESYTHESELVYAIYSASERSKVKDIDKIVKLIAKGYLKKDIAEELNITTTGLNKRLNAFKEELVRSGFKY